jgi:molybdenum cofactor biosynthesis enzyme MoaA
MHCGSDLIDPFGRAITYIRVSVTDRCDFRCAYCMAEDMTFLPRRELLSLEELDRLCSAFIEMGTRKIRITGGEPLVRRDIMGLFRSLSHHLEAGTLQEMTLTTNGSQLARFAVELARAAFVGSTFHSTLSIRAASRRSHGVAISIACCRGLTPRNGRGSR